MVSQRRRRLLSVTATAGVVALAGCSGGGDSGSSPTNDGQDGRTDDGGGTTAGGTASGTEWEPLTVGAGERLEWDLTLHEADGWIQDVPIDPEPGKTGTVTIEATNPGDVKQTYTVEYGDTTETAESSGESLYIRIPGWGAVVTGCIAGSVVLTKHHLWDTQGTSPYSGFELSVGTKAVSRVSATPEGTPMPAQKLVAEVVSEETYGGYSCFLIQERNYYGTYNEACVTTSVPLPVYGAWYGNRGIRELPDSPRAEMTLTSYTDSN